jgi:site-specific DNA-methyltransferase (adenine-specific)
LEDAGFTFKDMLAWEKPSAPHRAQRISEIYKRRGNEEQAQNWDGWRVANLRPLFEPILWFQKPYKTGGTLADNVIEHGVGGWNGSVADSNIFSFSYDKNDRGLHETQKPLRLMECMVSLVTQKGAIVLDPFAGSGTTCLAAKNLGRHYIGIEINNEFVDIARERVYGAPCEQQLVGII